MPSAVYADLAQRLIALALLLLVCTAILVLMDRLWLGQYQFYQSRIEQLQYRLQRLKRMAAMRPELETSIQKIVEDQQVAAQFLQGSSPALAAADLQQRIKELVETAGGEVLSAQALPEKEEGQAIRITVGVTVRGDVAVLEKTLYHLESQMPLLFVSNLQVTTRKFRPRLPNGRAAPYTRTRLNSRFDISGYLPKEGR
ncbi:MAG: hypothetical protein CSA09_05155 [Candidatus Contendobacter odensis]|uniref:General secretion pathway protein GspM n=1 Tax=Candidatus Contendibacter odensensis TaxID=1400860 RepID=A0A2G6PEY7_9GAMM|nr:MAG: hypothetical protein CSA09_05155 [Candidatus Contendobacter odensis]